MSGYIRVYSMRISVSQSKIEGYEKEQIVQKGF
jgi:hypothetical protein